MSIDEHRGPVTGPGGVPVVLGDLDLSGLAGAEVVEVAHACFRARNQASARLLTALHEAGRAVAGQKTRRSVLDEFSGDEAAARLGWSRAMATRWLDLADDLLVRLPEVHAAMRDGALDDTKARVVSDWTRDLAEDLAHRVCQEVLPEAPELPVAALIERIQQVAGALDPEWAARRERNAERRARVLASRNPSGTANVCGYDLPMERSIVSMARIEAIAAELRRRGVMLAIEKLRAEVYLAVLDGTAAGLDDDALIDLLASHLSADPDSGPDGDGPGDGPGPDDGPSDGPGPGDGGGPSDGGEPNDGGGSRDGDGPSDGDDPGDGSGPGDGPGEGGDEPSGNGDDSTGSEPHGSEPHGDDRVDRDVGGDVPDEAGDPCGADGDDKAGDAGDAGDGAAATARVGGIRDGTVELRLRLSTALGLDDLPAQIPRWGTLTAPTARHLLTRYHRGEWRVVLTDPDGRLEHLLLARRRPAPRGTAPSPGRRPPERPPGPRRRARRGRHGNAIVELQVPTTLLAALDPDAHPAWAALLRELRTRLPVKPRVSWRAGSHAPRARCGRVVGSRCCSYSTGGTRPSSPCSRRWLYQSM